MNLRPYQQDVIDQLYDWFRANDEGNPIISACVGAGKSVMLAKLCHDATTAFDSRSRVLMVVPSKELAEQNLQKLVAIAPDLRIGILSASMGRKDFVHDKDVILGTIGTLAKRADKLGFIDLILIDECHLVNRAETGMYRELVAAVQRNNHAVRVIGWTGTPYRGNGIWLTEGDNRLFTDIAARVEMLDLIQQGFLSPLAIKETETCITADGVGTSNTGDYIVSQIAQRIDRPEITERISKEVVRLGADRKKWLVFCATVDHAHHMADALTGLGVSCAVVSAVTPKSERENIINRLRSGELRCICNVAVLTTGFDVPDIDMIALARNTKSPVLYVQIAGRGMRVSPDKQDCLWLDFTDTTALLGPVDQIRGRAEPKKKDEKQPAPFKICDRCGANNAVSALYCVQCEKPFPPPVSKVNTFASNASVLSTIKRSEVFEITGVQIVGRVSRSTGLPYLQVKFQADFDSFDLNLMIEHDGYPRIKAMRQLRELAGYDVGFATVETAVKFSQQLASAIHSRVDSITVDMSSKWKNVIAWKLRESRGVLSSLIAGKGPFQDNATGATL